MPNVTSYCCMIDHVNIPYIPNILQLTFSNTPVSQSKTTSKKQVEPIREYTDPNTPPGMSTSLKHYLTPEYLNTLIDCGYFDNIPNTYTVRKQPDIPEDTKKTSNKVKKVHTHSNTVATKQTSHQVPDSGSIKRQVEVTPTVKPIIKHTKYQSRNWKTFKYLNPVKAFICQPDQAHEIWRLFKLDPNIEQQCYGYIITTPSALSPYYGSEHNYLWRVYRLPRRQTIIINSRLTYEIFHDAICICKVPLGIMDDIVKEYTKASRPDTFGVNDI